MRIVSRISIKNYTGRIVVTLFFENKNRIAKMKSIGNIGFRYL